MERNIPQINVSSLSEKWMEIIEGSAHDPARWDRIHRII